MSPTPPARVRLTTAKRALPDTVLERDPKARLGKFVKDLPPAFVERYIRAQEEWWLVTAQLHNLVGGK